VSSRLGPSTIINPQNRTTGIDGIASFLPPGPQRALLHAWPLAAHRSVTDTTSPRPAFAHVLADFSGVSAAQLQDSSLLSGLLIAAAGGSGLAAVGTPTVRRLPNGGLDGVLLLEGCHIALHSVPARGLLLVDVLAPQPGVARKAVEVFARRFASAKSRIEQRERG
jgi:S-adenosylmethionine/arginine decarboxylase-like enzyme